MGAGHRLLRVLEALAAGGTPGHLCEVCASITATTGAGIMLITSDVPEGSVCATDAVSSRLDDLQYTLGEGPGVDAYREARPILEPDLADPLAPRWMAFAPAAVDAGARAVHAFPLQLGAVRLGAVTLYDDHPGRLTDDQHADALVMANVATLSVLTMQAGAPLGVLADELADSASLQLVVHQATGMTAVQLGVSVREALIRLRAFAFRSDRRLADIAVDIVGGHLRLDRDASTGR